MNDYTQKLLERTISVVRSCETKAQFYTALNYCDLAAKIMKQEPMMLDILSNTINKKRWSLRLL